MIAPEQNADWYRVKYNLAALYATWSRTGDKKKREHRDSALQESRTLAIVALEQIVVRTGRGYGQGDPVLRSFLEESIVPAALLVYAGMHPDGEGPRRNPEGGTLAPEKLLAALRGEGLSGEQAIAYVLARHSRQPRIAYNLACVYAGWGSEKAARTQLWRAIELSGSGAPRLAQWALRDPALKGLLEGRSNKDLREDLEKAAAPPEAKSKRKAAARAEAPNTFTF